MAFGRSADKMIDPNERSCAHPLERVADERHQARMEAAYANQPLGYGAADGLGTYYARDREASLQVQHAVANP